MKLHYHIDFRGNFGDDLNVPFFENICPEYTKINFDTLIGIGTLLNDSLGEVKNSLIFGSGYGQGEPPKIDFLNTRILGVRGPRTAEALDLDPAKYVIGDPAMYVPNIVALNTGKPAANDCVVIALHHRTAEIWSFPEEEIDGVYFLDPAVLGIEDYIATIKAARYVLAEAMHGAIIASTYGVPFTRANILGKTNHEKWVDFFQSLELDVNPSDALVLPSPKPSFFRALAVKAAKTTNRRDALDAIKAPPFPHEPLARVVATAKTVEKKSNLIQARPDVLAFLTCKTEEAIDELHQFLECATE